VTALPPGHAGGPAGTGFGPGLFGKLPSHGDFVGRGLPPAFLHPWDHWLQHGLSAAWTAGGEDWSQRLRDGPRWRFALQADICGERAVAGVLIPSRDRLGRSFPLTLAASVAPGTDLAALPVLAPDWFQRLETAALEALARDWAADTLHSALAPLPPLPDPAASRLRPHLPGQTGWYLPLPPAPVPAITWPAIGRELARLIDGPFSLWWSKGSAGLPAALAVCPYLPLGAAFAALFDGDWERRGWDFADTALL
jgi:type VI secretion system protein ImpM